MQVAKEAAPPPQASAAAPAAPGPEQEAEVVDAAEATGAAGHEAGDAMEEGE